VRISLAAAVLLFASCADDPAKFDVHFASDFAHEGASVSVLGVYKDGRMSAESWPSLGPRLSAPFSRGTCEIAYGDALLSSNAALAQSVEDYATANGVTDDLLAELAPMARADGVLLVTIAGHPPQALGDAGAPRKASSSSAPAMRGGGRRGRGRMSAPSGDARPRTDGSVYEVSASVYSVRQRRSVAIVGMTYSGASVDEALAKFTARLAEELPGASCKGWDLAAPVDAEKIHRMSLEEP
jgi:hypothetical protein